MLKSKVILSGGVPKLYINERPVTAMAYTTYFPERSRHEDFIKAGYRIFFVNISFTARPFNSITGFSSFRVGVFDNPREENYSEFEKAVEDILSVCPDAIIFPRIYVSMPKWWTDANPTEVTATVNGGYRESLYSEKFRKDGAEMLSKLIQHIKNSSYAHAVAGWQLCGGQTQEWFHHGLNDGLGAAAQKPYGKWVEKTFGEKVAVLPEAEEFIYKDRARNLNENAKRYALFSSIGIARTLEFFAETVKKETGHSQVVGAFYGYSFESNDTVMFGSHALRTLLDSPNLDFFSAPNAYLNNRALGIDWADMLPVDSVKHHGKLCFIECDIRTNLTKAIQEARPGEYPDDIYRTADGKSVWSGPPTVELSVEAIRKSFAHQLTKASAIWWFDMWGGWYDDPAMMDELKNMREIYEMYAGGKEALTPEVVFFADEQAYSRMFSKSPQLRNMHHTRVAMGNTGVPYDSCMVEDAEKVLHKYKAAVFPMPVPSEEGIRAMELCGKMGIPFISASEEHYAFSVEEIKQFLKSTDVHFYTNENDVVYAGNGFVGLHTATGGKKQIFLPCKCKVLAVFGTEYEASVTDVIQFELKENTTVLFRVESVQKG